MAVVNDGAEEGAIMGERVGLSEGWKEGEMVMVGLYDGRVVVEVGWERERLFPLLEDFFQNFMNIICQWWCRQGRSRLFVSHLENCQAMAGVIML